MSAGGPEPSGGARADAAAARRVAALLPRTFAEVFAGRERLTPIQVKAIPAILAGRDVVVLASTGSGKSEAALAPLLERAAAGGFCAPALLWVSPTRALANDLERRFAAAVERLGRKLRVKLYDRPLPAVGRGREADLLVTTPEGLDALLASDPARLAPLRAAVLDDIHFLDGTPRGDQLRVVLARLAAALPGGRRPQVVCLSATVADPQGVGERYCAPGFEVAADPAARAVDLEVRGPSTEVGAAPGERTPAADVARAATSLLREARKVIVFANSLEEAEDLAESLKTALAPVPVLLHHASLEWEDRRGAEALLRDAETAVVVATSTLEVGIDVGGVGAVLLAGAPPSVEAFVQRAGRSAAPGRGAGPGSSASASRERRRGAHPARVLGLARSLAERTVFAVLALLAGEGRVGRRPYVFRTSVAVQQTFALLAAKAGRPRADLVSLLAPFLGGAAAADALIAHLVERGDLERLASDRLYLGEKVARLAERRLLYTNIPERVAVKTRAGERVGSVARTYQPGDALRLRGRYYRIIGEERAAIVVEEVPSAAVEGGRVSLGAPQGALGLEPEVAAAVRARVLGEGGEARPVLVYWRKTPEGAERATVFHFLGGAHGYLLGAAIGLGQGCGVKVGRLGMGLEASARFDPNLLAETLGDAERLRDLAAAGVDDRRVALARAVEMGPFFARVPRARQVEDLLAALDLPGFLEVARRLAVAEGKPALWERLEPFAG